MKATLNYANIDAVVLSGLNRCGETIRALAAAENKTDAVKALYKSGRLAEIDDDALVRANNARETAVIQLSRREISDDERAAALEAAIRKAVILPYTTAEKSAFTRAENACMIWLSSVQPNTSAVQFGEFSQIDGLYFLKAAGILSSGDVNGKTSRRISEFTASVIDRAVVIRKRGEVRLGIKRFKNTWHEIVLAIAEILIQSDAFTFDTSSNLVVRDFTTTENDNA